jgi:hypothetical protein
MPGVNWCSSAAPCLLHSLVMPAPMVLCVWYVCGKNSRTVLHAGLLTAVLLSCAHSCVVDARYSLKNLECSQAAAQHCGNCVSHMCVPGLHSSRFLCSWRMTLFISLEQNRLFGQELRSQQLTWLWHQQLRSDWYRHDVNCLTAFGLCRVPAKWHQLV